MSRPLMQLGVGDLESLFAKSKADVKALKQLEHELQHRQVPRAVALLSEVQAAMSRAQSLAPQPPVATPPQKQPSLWEKPATPAAASPQAVPIKATTPPPPPKIPKATQAFLPLEEAYKLLKATAGSTWESIEQTRRQLVLQSHPARLKSMSPEKQAQTLAEATRVNTAYVTLSQARCGRR